MAYRLVSLISLNNVCQPLLWCTLNCSEDRLHTGNSYLRFVRLLFCMCSNGDAVLFCLQEVRRECIWHSGCQVQDLHGAYQTETQKCRTGCEGFLCSAQLLEPWSWRAVSILPCGPMEKRNCQIRPPLTWSPPTQGVKRRHRQCVTITHNSLWRKEKCPGSGKC